MLIVFSPSFCFDRLKNCVIIACEGWESTGRGRIQHEAVHGFKDIQGLDIDACLRETQYLGYPDPVPMLRDPTPAWRYTRVVRRRTSLQDIGQLLKSMYEGKAVGLRFIKD